MGKNKAIARRPVEYVLITVLILLTVFGFWVYWYTDQQQADKVEPAAESLNYTGTLDEVNQLTEESINNEEQLYLETDTLYSVDSDSSAENVAGAYDESEY